MCTQKRFSCKLEYDKEVAKCYQINTGYYLKFQLLQIFLPKISIDSILERNTTKTKVRCKIMMEKFLISFFQTFSVLGHFQYVYVMFLHQRRQRKRIWHACVRSMFEKHILNLIWIKSSGSICMNEYCCYCCNATLFFVRFAGFN